MELKHKKVLVIGMARSGISVAKILNKLGAYVIMNDLKEENKLNDLINDIKPYVNEFILGNHVKNFESIDLIILSPGVPLNIEPLIKARKQGIEIIGELELAYRLLKGEFIAITGTNGKTTTTALIGEIFDNAGLHNHVVGNIGLPVISKMFESSEETYLITEVSSFQLETVDKFAPKISAILNITPDHLNRHKTMDSYVEAKKRVFMNQGKHDYLIVNYDQEITRKIGEENKETNVIYFSLKNTLNEGVFVKNNEIVIIDGDYKISVCKTDDIFILGDHNIENCLAATAIAYYAGINSQVIAKTLKNFKGVEHRIEYVRTYNDVKFYNDSKGTNPEATIKAIQAMAGSTVLIAGGMDKGSSFESLVEAFDDKVHALVLFGETKDIIKAEAEKHSNCDVYIMDNLEEAVQKSVEISKPNDSVLLSPACASWDMYESYEQRGQEFKSIVLDF